MPGFFNVDAVQQKNGADSHLIVDVHNENAHRFEKLKRRIPPQMERVDTLINILGKCVPELNTAPLYANLPAATDQISIVDWMYEHLSEQGLMVYEEWKEYFGHVPELKVLSEITFSEEPADFVYSLIEKIDWSTATIDPFEITYSVPWLEYINHFLAPEKLRLVDLWPFKMRLYSACMTMWHY